MPRKRKMETSPNGDLFGKRLAQLREAAGFSQYTLADAIGVSQRVVAYYEGETTFPPTHLLPAISKALGVSTDLLLGIETKNNRNRDIQLWRRFSQVEQLPSQKRKQVVTVIDALLNE